MKRILLHFLLLSAITAPLMAQAPKKVSFQAVLRNSSNQLLSNASVGMRVSILQGSSSGPVVYQETYSPIPKTNANGLVTLEIGTGNPQMGNFASLDWSKGPYLIKTETDPNGGSNYSIEGSTQILSVPYALYAQQVGEYPPLTLNDLSDVNTSGIKTGQIIKWNGTQWLPADDSGGSGAVVTNNTLTGNGSSASPLALAPQGATNGQVLKWSGSAWIPQNDLNTDAQNLSLVGQTLSISGGNSVTLPVGADNSPTNEIQTLSLSGGTLSLSLAGGTVFLPDNSPFNEIQQLGLSGNVLSLTPSGGSVTLSGGQWVNFADDIVNTNSGEVGIGTDGPLSKLHVLTTTGGAIRGEAANGFGVYGKSASGIGLSGESPESYAVFGNSINGIGGYFKTTTGTALRADGRVYINGNTGMGTEEPTQRLSVNGTAGKTGGGMWEAFSDRRLKQDIKAYQPGLREIMQVRPVRYHYNGKLGMSAEREYVGVIAQELQAIAPDMVSDTELKSGAEAGQHYLSVDPSAFTYMLINAVQEQQKTIEALKAEQQSLRAELDQLKLSLKAER